VKDVLKLLFFLSQYSADILKTFEELKAFVELMLERWQSDGVPAMGSDDSLLLPDPEQFPELVEAFANFPVESVGDTVKERGGLFRDLIKYAIENPEKIMALINLILSLTKGKQ
jgi:hypothetical protein